MTTVLYSLPPRVMVDTPHFQEFSLLDENCSELDDCTSPLEEVWALLDENSSELDNGSSPLDDEGSEPDDVCSLLDEGRFTLEAGMTEEEYSDVFPFEEEERDALESSLALRMTEEDEERAEHDEDDFESSSSIT